MMKIDKIEPSGRVKGRILAFLENGSVLKVTEKEVLDFSLYAGRELSQEEMKNIEASAVRSGAKKRAAHMVAARALSKKELEKRLVQKGEDAAAAAEAADWMEEIGAVDDRSYASSVVRHYSAMGYGPAKLRDELYRRGVPRNLWDEAIAEAPAPEETIERYIAAKLRGRAADEKTMKQISDGLRRRGFHWEDIRAAMCRLNTSLFEE